MSKKIRLEIEAESKIEHRDFSAVVDAIRVNRVREGKVSVSITINDASKQTSVWAYLDLAQLKALRAMIDDRIKMQDPTDQFIDLDEVTLADVDKIQASFP